MSLFHRHRWADESSVFTPPERSISYVKNITPELARDVFFGFTTIIQRCRCGAINVVKFSGTGPI